MIFITTFLVSLLTVVLFFSPIRKFLGRIGILGIDQQKKGKPRIPTSAGMIAIVGILAGIFFYIGIDSFLLNTGINLAYVLAGAFSILIITLIGFFDDISISPTPEKNKGMSEYRIGLKQWQKALLVLPAAVPLMAVKTGITTMSLPIVGIINFGIIYPLILIPLGVICVANATNMLAGMNGLECGTGLIAVTSIAIYGFLISSTETVIISISAVGAFLVLIYWNWSPAKILPGDSLTYLVGAVIVTCVILGNIEKFGIIIFIPWIIEALLKLRSKFSARSLGNLQADGTLKAPYKKIYSLTHVIMKIRPFKEWQITSILMAIEVIICLIAFCLFLNGII